MSRCLTVLAIGATLWVSSKGALAQSVRANGHAVSSGPSAVSLFVSVPTLAALDRQVSSVVSTAPRLAGTVQAGDGASPGKEHGKTLGAVTAARSAAQSVETPRHSLQNIPTCQ
jgi:hypothetical protein